jgi:two-component system, response regulator YesN
LYKVKIVVEKKEKWEKLVSWIQEEISDKCTVIDEEDDFAHIVVIEVRRLFDWLKISRMRKRFQESRVFLLLDPTLLKTSPLAIKLKLHYLIVEPVKKYRFLRGLKHVFKELARENYVEVCKEIRPEKQSVQNTLPFQDAFLRRLLLGQVSTEQELIQARSFLPGKAVPNIVYYIQGFVRFTEQNKREDWQVPMLIQHYFKRRFSEYGLHLSFLSYRKHLVMLMQIPNGYTSLKCWKDGENAILEVIETLKEKYGIYLFIGVGTVYREPLLLHHSYQEAKIARRTPPYERVSLRYFEEVTKDEVIKKCTEYIVKHYNEDLSIKRVAGCINLSVPYFCRIFKKETGCNFVEYVTFVRLQRAVWLLRHTNDTIEQIADKLGFNTPNYFSSTFKKYVGMSPSDYRATKEIIFI